MTPERVRKQTITPQSTETLPVDHAIPQCRESFLILTLQKKVFKLLRAISIFNFRSRHSRRRVRVWRRSKERHADVNIADLGLVCIAMHGGISMTVRTPTGRATEQFYRDNILSPIVVLFARPACPPFCLIRRWHRVAPSPSFLLIK